jgi:predicted CXXCH cytochrome family protein
MHRDDTRRNRLRIAGLVGGVIATVALLSCATVERTVVVTPEVPGAEFVGNRACFECHSNYTRIFPSSAHARIHVETAKQASPTGCESCHGPGSRHVAAGGGRGQFIVNPGKDAAACLQCHLDTAVQFRLPQHHPVFEGKMNCVQCHDPHGQDIMKPANGAGLGLARADESCAQCHREQTKPVMFPHEALREGCTVCHAPHGSINLKMLIQPDPNLCLRCHAQVQGAGVPSGQLVIGAVNHTALISRGACWSSGCHTAIHGSDANHHFLY